MSPSTQTGSSTSLFSETGSKVAFSRILSFLSGGSARSDKAVRNIAVSFLAKGVSIVCSLAIVPLTIDYLDPSQYGIWLTLSSIIGWISYLDLGIGNGFRNRFAEAKAVGDMKKAREYVSTAYFSVSVIMGLALLALLLANHFVDLSSVLKVDSSYGHELRDVFAVLCMFFCLNMVFSLFSTLMTADQKPGVSSILNAVGQMLSVVVIFVLTRTSSGSLFNLALYYSGVPCIVMLLASLATYTFSSYKELSPSISTVRFRYIKDIISLGVKFFVICISMVAIFQVVNIVLSRELGPLAVTQYNIAFKYFNILLSVMIIVITPFWTAFTDAFSQREMDWMKSTLRRLERTWVVFVLGGLLMLALSGTFYGIWIKDKVEVPFLLSLAMFVYTVLNMLANIYMYLINGIGAIRIQLVIYLVFALVAWPLLSLSCRVMGVYGVLIVPSAVYLLQALLGKIQLSRILSDSAHGWWIK